MAQVPVFVDCEAPMYEPPVPALTHMTEFGAVINEHLWFHGKDDSKETFQRFADWLEKHVSKKGDRPVFVSDNPAYDWQWISYGFFLHLGFNPFGHSARRISDFYAGLVGDWKETQKWKRLRVTPHTHNGVDDAKGNYEAWKRMMAGER